MAQPKQVTVRAAASAGAALASVVDGLGTLLPWLVVALAAILGLRRLDNADTWWHLAAGRWIAEHAAVPRTDVLSFTVPDHPWTDLQWLFELALYGLHRTGGPTALVLGAALAYALATTLLVRNLRLALGPVGAAVLALWATAIAQERFAIRPEMVSFLLLEVVLWLCATGRATEDARLWLLPVVMLVWVNTHALFIIGALVIACHMAGAAAERLSILPAGWRGRWKPPAARRLLVSGAAALLVTLLNPYGGAGVVFPLKLMTRISGSNPVFSTIGEFRRPFSGYFVTFAVSAYQLFFVFGIAVAALAAVLTARSARPRLLAAPGKTTRSRAERQGGDQLGRLRPTNLGMQAPPTNEEDARFDLGSLAVFVTLAYLSLLARRNMALFALGTAPFVGLCVSAVRTLLPAAARRIADLATRTLAAILLPALVAAVWFVASNGFYRWNSELHEFGTGVLGVMLPARAFAFVKAMKLPGPLYNDVTTGGYLTWDRAVDGGVYIDGRLEVYDVDFFSNYIRGLSDPAHWQVDVDARGIQTVVFLHWWPNHRPLIRHLLGDRRWALVYFDEVVLVLIRREGHAELIARCADTFGPLRQQIADDLLRPVSSWQRPVGRVRGLGMYAALLDLTAKPDEAVRFYSRLLELRPPAREEGAVELRLAQYHAGKGEMSLARMYLRRAAQADPTNPGIATLAARLGQ